MVKPISVEVRRLIVAARAGGMSTKCAAETFQVTPRSIQNFVAQQRNTGTLEPGSCARQPSSRKITPEEENDLRAQLDSHPDATIDEHCDLWREKTGTKISSSAMGESIRRANWTYKKKRFTQKSARKQIDSSSAAC